MTDGATALRDRLQGVVDKARAQAMIDRSVYVSVKELADMLGPNIRGIEQLSALIGTMELETISTRNAGRNTWLTEEQAKQVIARVLSHPTRLLTGETEE